MSEDRVSTSEGPSIATILLFLLGVAGLAFSLTLVFLAMRSVMEVGGSCADGGPYVSAQRCPDNATLFILVAVFGGFGWGALTTNYGSKMRGPYGTLALLAWPALFCSLGFNFLQYGFNPPQGFGPGPELGFVIPGVMFELMGAVPLVLALRFGTSVVSSVGSADADRIRAAEQAVGLDPDALTESAPDGGFTFTTLAADGSIVPGVADASFDGIVGWRGGQLDRLLDRRHAALVEAITALLRGLGWQVAVEVSFNHFGDRGSIDVLAAHSSGGPCLVVEVKSELTAIEETIRRLDVKARLAPTLALDRFAVRPTGVSRLLVLPDSTTARDRVATFRGTFAASFPARSVEVRGHLRRPNESAPFAGMLFLRDTNRGSTARARSGSSDAA